MIPISELPACPVATTLRLIGNKWKVFIIQRLLERAWRYNELQRSLPGISRKVLTENLKNMELDELIVRTEYPGSPPRVEYSLSACGRSMQPIICAMWKWGKSYQREVRRHG